MQTSLIVDGDTNRSPTEQLDTMLQEGWKVVALSGTGISAGGHSMRTYGKWLVILEKPDTDNTNQHPQLKTQ